MALEGYGRLMTATEAQQKREAMTGATCPPQKAVPSAEAIGELQRELCDLETECERLFGRLEVVLGPAQPTTEGTGKANYGPQSPLTEALRSITVRIVSMRFRMTDTLNRLEV